MPTGLLGLIVLFLVLALVAYVLGARGVAGFSMELARILIVVFVILAVLALIGVAALPWLMPWIFRLARWLGARVPEQRIPPRVIVVSAAINVVAWGIYGVAFLFLNRGLVNLPAYDLMQHIAVNAASYVVGYMVFFVPAGLGFRESALQRTMVAAHMASHPQAVAVSLVSRLWQLIILILPALIFFAYRRPPNEKDPAAG